ncbi:unnamed protein product [Brassica rapa]|uniref:Transmembrane protein n=1 Tax=Brassica campestris TaxID=3711 RepID=A0A8D9MA24_BRACM|nr:unnamed protein product [Brassica rapa]
MGARAPLYLNVVSPLLGNTTSNISVAPALRRRVSVRSKPGALLFSLILSFFSLLLSCDLHLLCFACCSVPRVSLKTSSHVRSSVSGVDCEGWSNGAGSVYSQAEESAFRAVQGAPLTPWRASSAWRRVGVSPSVSSAVFGLSWSRRAMVVWCRFSVFSWASRSGGICSTCDLRASEVRLLEGVCSSCVEARGGLA